MLAIVTESGTDRKTANRPSGRQNPRVETSTADSGEFVAEVQALDLPAVSDKKK